MKHYTYLIKNMLTGKKYIGVHTCDKEIIDDNYWGSSKSLTESINTLGKDHFKKRILKIHNTRKLAVLHEIELHTTYDVAVNKNFYNKAKQTSTGFDLTGTTASIETRRKKSVSVTATVNSTKWQQTIGVIKSARVSQTRQGWTDDTKKTFANKISQTRKELGLAKGKNNPMYGKIGAASGKKWYSSCDESRLYIPGTEPAGYVLGRNSVKGSKNPNYKNKYKHENE